MRRLLVTGGAGFIGTNFVLHWMHNHPQDKVVVLDALTYAGKRENLSQVEVLDNFEFIHGNVVDQALVESLLQGHQLDTIVHFAAESHVDRSITGPGLFLETNIIGTHSLLQAAKRVWLDQDERVAHLFHHISTDEVYGSLAEEDPAFSEQTAYAPNSPYSASKASSDHLVRAYHHTYGLNTVTTNCSNNYGPYQNHEKLIPLVIRKILEGESIPIYGDGKNVRDWLFVEDHCRGIELAMTKGRYGECYNIGGGVEAKNIEIVELLCRIVDEKLAATASLKTKYPHACVYRGESSETLISFVEDRPGHDRRYAIDATKAECELGYIPRESFVSGVGKTVEWYLSQ